MWLYISDPSNLEIIYVCFTECSSAVLKLKSLTKGHLRVKVLWYAFETPTMELVDDILHRAHVLFQRFVDDNEWSIDQTFWNKPDCKLKRVTKILMLQPNMLFKYQMSNHGNHWMITIKCFFKSRNSSLTSTEFALIVEAFEVKPHLGDRDARVLVRKLATTYI